jgi:hypothetical protein
MGFSDKAKGKLGKFKARLMAKGFTQTHDVNFGETFALVAKFVSIRTFL